MAWLESKIGAGPLAFTKGEIILYYLGASPEEIRDVQLGIGGCGGERQLVRSSPDRGHYTVASDTDLTSRTCGSLLQGP